jgi:hypothetical protein
MIIAAAIKFGNMVCHLPKPNRHHDILHQLHGRTESGFEGYDMEQGFLTDKGEFLDRSEAMQHCLKNGQVLGRRIELLKHSPTNYNGFELFSEDLW